MKFDEFSPIDIMKVAMREMAARGEWSEAARIAQMVMPYCVNEKVRKKSTPPKASTQPRPARNN